MNEPDPIAWLRETAHLHQHDVAVGKMALRILPALLDVLEQDLHHDCRPIEPHKTTCRYCIALGAIRKEMDRE